MKSINKYINEALDTFSINGTKVKENDWIWVKDPENSNDEICVQVYNVTNNKITYHINGKSFKSVPLSSFIEKDKKGKSKNKDNSKQLLKLKQELKELHKQMKDVRDDMESDPEVAEIAARGDEPVSYSRKMNFIQKKIDKIQDKIDAIEHPGKTLRWKSYDSYMKTNPKEGEDYNWE